VIASYGSHPSQHGELLLPADGGPHAVVVLVHGGFWRDRFDRHLMDGLAHDLVAHGFASWNIEYRRTGRDGGGWPATGDDVAAAVDHLAAIDAPVDTEQVAIVGHSAGGHLAVWAASRQGGRVRARAVVSLAGVLDLADAAWRGLGTGAVLELMGAAPEDDPGGYAQASPVERLPVGIPTLVLHGDADDRVPVDLSFDFHSRARQAGDPTDLVVLGGVDHFAVIDPASAAWHLVRAWLQVRM
jgi:acetyl esterase/lipase